VSLFQVFFFFFPYGGLKTIFLCPGRHKSGTCILFSCFLNLSSAVSLGTGINSC